MVKRDGASFGGDGDVLKWTMVVDAELSEDTQNQLIVHSPWVNHMLCELNRKAVLKIRCPGGAWVAL